MSKETVFLTFLFIILWNSGFISAEYVLPYAQPFTILFWRYLVLTILVLTYIIVKKKIVWRGWKPMVYSMLIGILAHGVWLGCVLFSLENDIPAGIIAMIISLQPLAIGALSGLITGERAHTFQWFGLMLGFGGVIFTLGFRVNFSEYQSIIGYLLPIGAVISMTIATLIQRRLELHGGALCLPVDICLFYQSLATLFVSFIPAFLIEDLSTQWNSNFILAMSWLVLAVSLGAYSLMWVLIKRLSAWRMASLFYFGAPVTMFMAWFSFGDTSNLMDIMGLAMIFAGVALTYSPFHKNSPNSNEMNKF